MTAHKLPFLAFYQRLVQRKYCLLKNEVSEWVNIFYVAFCTIMAIARQKEVRSLDYALRLLRMTSMVLYIAQYHRQRCTLHAVEQFGAVYMHNHYDKYPSRQWFEPGTSRLQAPVDTNEPLGPASEIWRTRS